MKIFNYLWSGVVYYWNQYFGPKVTTAPVKLDEVPGYPRKPDNSKALKDMENYFCNKMLKEDKPPENIYITNDGKLLSTTIEQTEEKMDPQDRNIHNIQAVIPLDPDSIFHIDDSRDN